MSYRVSLREHPVFSAQVSSFTVSSALSQLVNRAEISHLNPRGNWSRCGMPLWKWTCELVTDLFQELFHFLGWSLILNRLQFYFGCLMLRFSSGYVKTKIGGTDKYQIIWYPTRIQFCAAFQGKYVFKNKIRNVELWMVLINIFLQYFILFAVNLRRSQRRDLARGCCHR